jgi:fumarate reductase subunit D
MTRAAARSFTVQEERAFRLERWSLYVQLAVAVIAAVISFQALRDAGLRMGLDWAAPLLPLAIDGFAVIASLGIIRSQGAGERFSARASEWLGLCFVLALSIAGNVAHALDRMDPDFPRILAGLFGSAPPIIVAYGIHVYGRAMTSGVSRHVLVDDPDKIHFGLTHLGEGGTVRKPGTKRQTARAAERADARTTKRANAQEADPVPVPASGARYARNPERQRAFEVWSQLHTGQPVNAKEVLRAAQVTKDESTVRRWCRAWEKEADVDLDVQEAGRPRVPQSA